MKTEEMEIGTFYFLPYRMRNPLTENQMFDCITYQDGRLYFIDSCSYFVETDEGMKSLRSIAYPYETEEE